MVFEVAAVLCAVTAVWVLFGSNQRRVLRLVAAAPEHDAGTRTSARRPLGPWLRLFAGLGAATLSVALLGAVGGLAAAGGGAFLWLRARERRRRPERLPVTDDLPVLIGLIASGIRAGVTLPACLTAVSGAARGGLGEEIAAVSEQLRLGAEPALAWRRQALPEPLAEVGRDLIRATETGAPVADQLDRHVADLRRQLKARTTARIERMGVLVVAPLGLCFLPAFILIGVVPMAADLLTTALSY
ncbi:type II secretion system F family protein [Nocardiopsis metallicus]|uniref:Pilus assembly protein TadC n=1 Tax=Nocardiopsis metallicus TaxID=179819 RepID=A0A840WUG1_9ACTN|nr:type II secretion system F family protein [Nocardiopsis metallicus]MBB5493788.1 pilus assembly protein TadC [Nocardiopsis metallicus]